MVEGQQTLTEPKYFANSRSAVIYQSIESPRANVRILTRMVIVKVQAMAGERCVVTSNKADADGTVRMKEGQTAGSCVQALLYFCCDAQ